MQPRCPPPQSGRDETRGMPKSRSCSNLRRSRDHNGHSRGIKPANTGRDELPARLQREPGGLCQGTAHQGSPLTSPRRRGERKGRRSPPRGEEGPELAQRGPARTPTRAPKAGPGPPAPGAAEPGPGPRPGPGPGHPAGPVTRNGASPQPRSPHDQAPDGLSSRPGTPPPSPPFVWGRGWGGGGSSTAPPRPPPAPRAGAALTSPPSP